MSSVKKYDKTSKVGWEGEAREGVKGFGKRVFFPSFPCAAAECNKQYITVPQTNDVKLIAPPSRCSLSHSSHLLGVQGWSDGLLRKQCQTRWHNIPGASFGPVTELRESCNTPKLLAPHLRTHNLHLKRVGGGSAREEVWGWRGKGSIQRSSINSHFRQRHQFAFVFVKLISSSKDMNSRAQRRWRCLREEWSTQSSETAPLCPPNESLPGSEIELKVLLPKTAAPHPPPLVPSFSLTLIKSLKTHFRTPSPNHLGQIIECLHRSYFPNVVVFSTRKSHRQGFFYRRRQKPKNLFKFNMFMFALFVQTVSLCGLVCLFTIMARLPGFSVPRAKNQKSRNQLPNRCSNKPRKNTQK